LFLGGQDHDPIPYSLAHPALVFSAPLLGQTTKTEGLITGRSGPSLTIQTKDSPPDLVVLLSDSTQVSQIKGLFKARRKEISMAALIPGLEIQVEGTYNSSKQLVASSIKFKGNDLEQAQSVQAGVEETKTLAKQNEQQAALNKEKLVLFIDGRHRCRLASV
jgi:hypothetical protein